MMTPWGIESIFGDGEHQGHIGRFWVWLKGWAWCDKCQTWEPAEPEQGGC